MGLPHKVRRLQIINNFLHKLPALRHVELRRRLQTRTELPAETYNFQLGGNSSERQIKQKSPTKMI
jgi:hypothetical protein